MPLQAFLFLIAFFVVQILASSQEPMSKGKALKQIANAKNSRISEEGFVPINGIRQWITIRGNRSKPVLLFLHGGPGSPISPYANNLYKDWENDFVLVQWDQRGTGKTFGFDAPEELTTAFLKANPLTVEQMTADGIAVTEYLLKHLGKKKLILLGTSWGSVLGVEMATKQPDLFYGYVGHSQVVNLSDDKPLYTKTEAIAQQKKDSAALNVLAGIGLPPYTEARKVGMLMRVVKKYESASSLKAPADWFVEAGSYDNEKDRKHREDGDDYSFVSFIGDQRLGVSSMRSTINFLKDRLHFKIPVFFIQGELDLLTPKEITKQYFDRITAPWKEFILLPHSAHGFNLPVVEAQYKLVKGLKTS